MENQNGSKEVKLNTETQGAEMQKPTYAELEKGFNELYGEYQNVRGYAIEMEKQISQINMSNLFGRLSYLFKVLEFSKMFDDTFVEACASEIKDRLTIKEAPKAEPNKEDTKQN